ncbi:Homoserine dehydrogenase [uncultured archaeon]|nr:Homoserine dehydrogenase [uncultured archaeon]
MVVELGIGLVGAGNIGSGVVEIILKNAALIEKRTGVRLILARVCDKNSLCVEKFGVSKSIFTSDYKELIADKKVNVVVELIGGYEPAHTVIVDALNAKKHVVTANKAVIAKFGYELFELAQNKGVNILFEAAVGGCIPIIRTIEESYSSDKIKCVRGILNGTTNFILTKMSAGMEYADALKKAQELGFAEADPSFDVEGKDAAQKATILASLAFDAKIEGGPFVCGITSLKKADMDFASEIGFVIKLLAVAKKRAEGVELRVHPVMVPKSHPFANVSNEINAVALSSENTGDIFLSGRGAGKLPTATVVVTDLIEMGSRVRVAQRYFEKIKLIDFGESEFKYYLRLGVLDKPGVLAAIGKVLGDNGVSINSCIQKGAGMEVVPIVIVTHLAKEKQMSKALIELKKLSVVKEAELIRIEEF